MRASPVIKSIVLLLVLVQISGQVAGKVLENPRRPAENDTSAVTSDVELADPPTEPDGGDSGEGVDDGDEAPDGREYLENASEASAGSRSTGGEIVNPFSWLATSWFPHTTSPTNYKNDKLGGMMVRLNDDTLLAHKDTCLEPQFAYSDGDVNKHRDTEQVSLRVHPQIDATRGIAGKRRFGCSYKAATDLEHGFGVYRLNHLLPDLRSADYFERNRIKQRPPLQHDPMVKDNCHLHSYSGNADPLGKQNSRSVLSGRLCGNRNDVGAPILCGKEQKLSYLTLPREASGCYESITALRVADHFKTLSEYVNATAPGAPVTIPTESIIDGILPFPG